MNHNSLEKKFSLGSLTLFALPNIAMMIFLSFYTIVDGIFVSRYAGTTALSAINMVYPTVSVQMAAAIMLSTGGSAIIARKMGEGKENEARENFSFITLVILILGVLTTIFGLIFLEPIVRFLGASEAQFELCKVYGGILFAFAPAFFLQVAFQTFFVTAGSPGLGLIVTLCGGLSNIVLDYLFIAVLGMGIRGAAIATGIGYCIPAVAGLIYFGIWKKKVLHFGRPRYSGRMLFYSCTNGSSEMVSNLANAVTTFLFNMMFLKYYGESGVASITIVLYFQFVFTAVHFGYSMGAAPVISYKYGRGDRQQLKKIFNSSLWIVGICSIGSYALSRIVIEPAVAVFTKRGSEVFRITVEGFPIYAVGFLLMGLGIFASSMFTAFSDGLVSAIISFARTFVFLAGAILLLPLLMGKIGIWYAVPVAEVLGIAVSVFFLIKKKSVYHY